jgi:hypothetical protein
MTKEKQKERKGRTPKRHLIQEHGGCQDVDSTRILQLMSKLFSSVERIAGCDDGSQHGNGMEGDRVLGDIRTVQGQNLLLLQSFLM